MRVILVKYWQNNEKIYLIKMPLKIDAYCFSKPPAGSV